MRKLIALPLLALMATTALAGTRTTTVQKPDVQKQIVQDLQRKAASGTVGVLLGLNVAYGAPETLTPSERDLQNRQIAAAKTRLRSDANFRAAFARQKLATPDRFDGLPTVSLNVTAAELTKLLHSPQIATISADAVIKVTQNLATKPAATNAAPRAATTSTGKPAAPTKRPDNTGVAPVYQDSLNLIKAPQAWAKATGAGYSVVIIDDGVQANHPFLAGKVKQEACFKQGQLCAGQASSSGPGTGGTDGTSWLGTMTAGVAAGREVSTADFQQLAGVAKDADLISINVKSDYGLYTSDILAALNKVLTYPDSVKTKIASVFVENSSDDVEFTNSSGATEYYTNVFSGSCDDYYPDVARTVDALKKAGIAVVAGTGEFAGPAAKQFPSCITGVVSVSSVTAANVGMCFPWTTYDGTVPQPTGTAVDKVYCISNTAPDISLFAPGTAVVTSKPDGGYFSIPGATIPGTFLAAAQVAGAFAVLKQKYPKDSVDDNLLRLRMTGNPIIDWRDSNVKAPRFDLLAAVSTGPFNTLSLNMSEKLKGTITFRVAGYNYSTSCRSSCKIKIPYGKVVTASYTGDKPGSVVNWQGLCSLQQSCAITLNGDKTMVAVPKIGF